MATATTNLSLIKPELDATVIRTIYNTNLDTIDGRFSATYMAVQAKNAVSITGGSITGITDLAIADGGTGAGTAANARTALGCAATAQTFYIGTTQVAINRASGALTLAGITLTTPNIGIPSAGTLTNCTFPTLNQNTTGSAATLTTARTINGVSFNGSANITVTADANTLSNTTLKSTVITSSLTRVGTITTGGLGSGAVLAGVTMTLGADADGDIYYRTGNVLTRLAKGTEGHYLKQGAAIPEWAAGAGGYTNLTSFIAQTAFRVFYSNTAGDVTELALGADGTYLKSNGADQNPSFGTPTGSGDVSKVGTPADSQVGVWTGDGTIEGDASLTYDRSNLQLTGDIGSTGTRITKGWFANLETTGDLTVNGTALASIYSPIASPTFTTQITTPIIDLTGGQIAFPADIAASADANTLDDYEEGTWTPALEFGGASVDMTYTAQAGAYTKIGRAVIINALVYLSAKGTSTGDATITGLPFAVKNAAGNTSVVQMRFNYISFADFPQGIAYEGTSTIYLNEITNAGVLTTLTNANFANNSSIFFSTIYFTD